MLKRAHLLMAFSLGMTLGATLLSPPQPANAAGPGPSIGAPSGPAAAPSAGATSTGGSTTGGSNATSNTGTFPTVQQTNTTGNFSSSGQAGTTGPGGTGGQTGTTGPGGTGGQLGTTGPGGSGGQLGTTGPGGSGGQLGTTGPGGAGGQLGTTGPGGAGGQLGTTGPGSGAPVNLPISGQTNVLNNGRPFNQFGQGMIVDPLNLGLFSTGGGGTSAGAAVTGVPAGSGVTFFGQRVPAQSGAHQVTRLQHVNAKPIAIGMRNVINNGNVETVAAPIVVEYDWGDGSLERAKKRMDSRAGRAQAYGLSIYR